MGSWIETRGLGLATVATALTVGRRDGRGRMAARPSIWGPSLGDVKGENGLAFSFAGVATGLPGAFLAWVGGEDGSDVLR